MEEHITTTTQCAYGLQILVVYGLWVRSTLLPQVAALLPKGGQHLQVIL